MAKSVAAWFVLALGVLASACASENPRAQIADADCEDLERILRETTPGEVGGSGLSGLVEVGEDFVYMLGHPKSLFGEDRRGLAWTAYHERGC